MNSLSILIPCYNVEKIIIKNIKKLNHKLKKKKIVNEIILINDGSKDNTLLKLKKVQKKNIKIITYKKNKGKSYAIRKGLKIARYKYIIFIDSDLPYFNKFNFLIRKINSGYGFVGIDRRHQDSRILEKNFSLYKYLRKSISYILNKIINYYLNFENLTLDTQSGLKAFQNLKIFKKKKFISNKFFLDIELIHLFKNKKISFCFIPVKYKINNISSIKIFSLENLKIILELVMVLKKLKKN